VLMVVVVSAMAMIPYLAVVRIPSWVLLWVVLQTVHDDYDSNSEKLLVDCGGDAD
jgi:hypothetical protein